VGFLEKKKGYGLRRGWFKLKKKNLERVVLTLVN